MIFNKNKKGFLQFITVPIIIGVIVFIGLIFAGTGFFLSWLTKNLLSIVGILLLFASVMIAIKAKKFDKTTMWVFGFGVFLIILNIVLKKFEVL